MNELPVMPIRAKYADETTKGVNIDTALETSATDITALETTVGDSDSGLVKDVADLKTTVGDSSAGLVKKVSDLEDKTTKILYTSGSDTTNVNGNFTANSIIENMSGYSYTLPDDPKIVIDYAGVSKTGNKLTFVEAGRIVSDEDGIPNNTRMYLGEFTCPTDVMAKIYPMLSGGNLIDLREAAASRDGSTWIKVYFYRTKSGTTKTYSAVTLQNAIGASTEYAFRYECTFLLSENLAVQL